MHPVSNQKNSLAKKTIGITGGAGFIGQHLAARLLDEGATVVILDNLSVGTKETLPAHVSCTVGDIRDSALVKDVLADVDAVVHLAARVAIRDSLENFMADADINFSGTLTILDAIRQARPERCIFASSMAVYGEGDFGIPVPETHALKPLSPYGVTKLAAERMVEIIMRTSGKNWFNMRIFNTYGPGQALSPYVGVIRIFRDRIVRGQPLTIFGDGRQVRDYIHVSDVVAGLLQALKAPGACSGTYNLGTGTGTSVLEIAEQLQAQMQKSVPIQMAPMSPVELKWSVADISRARDTLKFQPRMDLASGLSSSKD